MAITLKGIIDQDNLGLGILIIPPSPAAFQLRTSGNARGANAIDLQTKFINDTQIASGDFSVIGGGSGNTASGYGSVIPGGNNNFATNTNATVGGGTGNTASGQDAVITGGGSNNATGNSSVVIGGSSNTASAIYTAIVGGLSNVASATFSSIGGGRANLAAGADSSVIGGRGNKTNHTHSIAGGGGAHTTSNFDVVFGQVDTGTPSTNNVHFRIAGNNSDVHIGRQINQAAVAGAANNLVLHTVLANFQSRAISIKAPDTLTASYPLIMPTAQGGASTVLQNDGSGVLSWQTPAGGSSDILSVEVAISSSQMLNSFTTPIPILSAPGAGKAYQFLSCTLMHAYGTTTYAGNIHLRENGVSLGNMSAGLASTADSVYSRYAPITVNHAVNTAWNMSPSAADPTDGDGTFKVRVHYRLYDVNA